MCSDLQFLESRPFATPGIPPWDPVEEARAAWKARMEHAGAVRQRIRDCLARTTHRQLGSVGGLFRHMDGVEEDAEGGPRVCGWVCVGVCVGVAGWLAG
jgi:hypothetical protein